MSISTRWAFAMLPMVLPGAALAQSTQTNVDQTRRAFDIPPGKLADALERFTRQTRQAAAIGDARMPIYTRPVERWRSYAPHLPELTNAFPPQ